jgi:hypothetical protein
MSPTTAPTAAPTAAPDDPEAVLAVAQDRIRADDTGAYQLTLTLNAEQGVTETGTYRLSSRSRAGRQTSIRGGKETGADILAVGHEYWLRGDDMPRDCWLQAGEDVGSRHEGHPVGVPPAVAVVMAARVAGVDGRSVVVETDLAALAASIAAEDPFGPQLDLPRDSRGTVVLDLAEGRVTGWHASVADVLATLEAVDGHSPVLRYLDRVSEKSASISVELTEPGRAVDISHPPDDEIALLTMDSTDPHLDECMGF